MNFTEQVKSKKQNPILYGPNIRGDGQIIRNLLIYLKVQFQEKQSRIIKNSQGEFICSFLQLELQGLYIFDSISIFRHLCRFYQRTDLLGMTPQNRATINEFLFKFADIRIKIIKRFSEAAKAISIGKENPYTIKLRVLQQILEEDCIILKSFIYGHMKCKTWIMGYLTIADFFFSELCFYLVNFFGSVIENHMIYRQLKNYKKLFESQQFVLKQRDSKKIFPPFRAKDTLEIIKNAWQGDKEIVS